MSWNCLEATHNNRYWLWSSRRTCYLCFALNQLLISKLSASIHNRYYSIPPQNYYSVTLQIRIGGLLLHGGQSISRLEIYPG